MKSVVKKSMGLLMGILMVLLISSSVYANDPPPDKNGIVTVVITEYLVFSVWQPNFGLTVNKLYDYTPPEKTSTVAVKSNIDWIASVVATSSDLVGKEDLGIGVLKIDNVPMEIGKKYSKSGSKTENKEFKYRVEIPGNPAPGYYHTYLTYSVTAETN